MLREIFKKIPTQTWLDIATRRASKAAEHPARSGIVQPVHWYYFLWVVKPEMLGLRSIR